MNILYLSNLSGNLFAGPNNSVPAQVKAQARLDNVFWYNLNNTKREEWTRDGLDCKCLTDYPTGRLADLPAPFNHPDVVVLEELYCFPFSKIVGDVQRLGIPYVIIPRSAMTAQGQKKSRLKKIVGNALYFNRLVKKAAAIQYLTERERLDSEPIWKKSSFVIPNGINPQPITRAEFSKNGIRAAYIGRYEIYQKGLDILLDALGAIQDDLRKLGFKLSMYGQDQESTLARLGEQASRLGIEDIVSFGGAVFGEEKKQVLLETDVFVLTSRFEGHPMGLIEALSYGLPCVATDGTNIAGEISSYSAGWTATADAESIKNAFLKMLADRDKLPAFGKNAVALSDTYAWDEIASKSHIAYETVSRNEK